MKLSVAFKRLSKKEKVLDKRLLEINNLRERFKEVKHCGITKHQYLQALKKQDERLAQYATKLYDQYLKILELGKT
jgi:hypothetical protein